MRSPDSRPSDGLTRRRLLVSSVGISAGLSGCLSRVPGGRADAVDSVKLEGEGGSQVLWKYPQTEAVSKGEEDGIGYASVTLEGKRNDGSELRFRLNSTVGEIAASPEYEDYQADWFRFRIGPPSAYTAQHVFEMSVQPPPWPDLDVGYDDRGGRKELVVEAKDVGSDGTVVFPVQFLSAGGVVPDTFVCSFAVQASEPGVLGETVRAQGTGFLEPGSVG
jgi:hypothetical protein